MGHVGPLERHDPEKRRRAGGVLRNERRDRRRGAEAGIREGGVRSGCDDDASLGQPEARCLDPRRLDRERDRIGKDHPGGV